MKTVSVVGAGLVGSLISIILSRKGYKVNVLERRPDMRRESISAGRSINLALSERGWRALELVGIAEDVKKIAIPMFGRMIHDENGNLNYLPYGKENQAIYSVSRGELNKKLMDLAEREAGVAISFNSRCADIDIDNAVVKLDDGTQVAADHIIGADGAYSAARLRLQMTDRFDYQQFYIPHGYKELTIPAGEDGKHQLEKNALHIWPRGQFMLIALPNEDGSFTCTLFFPFEGEASFSTLDTEQKVLSFFESTFPDAIPLMPTLIEDYFRNPASSLVSVKCSPWYYKDKLSLIGDAAHAIVPFFGQGMNAGFEDCRVFSELLDKHEYDFHVLFKRFFEERKANADAICELALRNFIEMRDLVAQPDFLLRKKIESKFASKYPDKWIPLYSMVTFSHLPYSFALEEGNKQDRIMQKVLSLPEVEKRWDSEEIEQVILRELEQSI